MRKKIVEITDMPFEERLKMATHYRPVYIQPNKMVEIGFINKYNSFETLYISLHKKEAKRKNLTEYKAVP